jgi:hypothetical protein
MVNGSKTKQYWFEGMYGAEDRVRAALEKKGWRYFYTHAPYSKLTKSDLYNNHFILREYEMLDVIKDNLKSDCVAGCPRSKLKDQNTCGEKRCKDFVKKYMSDHE